MAGLLGTMNTALKGLNAQQIALDTASNNISNASTEGYSRQRVELAEDTTYHYPGIGRIGTGVKIEGVIREADALVEKQIQSENSTLNKYSSKNEVVSQIEIIFNESDNTGINYTMGQMFNAWQDLSDNPESFSAKSVVVENSKTFANTVNQMAEQLDQLGSATVMNLQQNTFDINTIVDQLKVLNDQIANITLKGDSPNDLLDKRDLLMKNLSGLAGYSANFDSLGRVSVNLGGKLITAKDADNKLSTVNGIVSNIDGSVDITIAVDGDMANIQTVTVSADAAQNIKKGSLVYFDKDAAEPLTLADINSGKIGGNQEALAEINERMDNLNSFVNNMAAEVNKLHNPDGNGADFFTFNGEKNAVNFMVNKDVQDDERKVVTGESSNSAAGDGSRALSIANLRNSKLDSGNTFEEIYSSIITKIGVSTQYSSNMVDNQQAVMEQLENRRESISGVSIDEEVTNIIQSQKIYGANSRVISTVSEMLDTLINMART